jgi:hypothetical protein
MDESKILTAIQTGWLSVEAFGLLRRYARHGKLPSPEKIDPERRFKFSERVPNLYTQLIISLQELRITSARLIPELPPPIPDDLSQLLLEAKADITPLWERFDGWSSQVWNTLQVSEPLAGQAFTCGGDLADTYWYAQGAGADKLAGMLRSFRLSYMAERVDDLADHLPIHVAQAIHHSLARWGIGERVNGLDKEQQKRILDRLESQLKVWRDLLFGLRNPDSYLTPHDKRRITWGAVAATAGLVVFVGVAVWLAVLLLAGLGRNLIGASMSLPVDTSQISSDVLAYLSNWQNWSALLATLSSVLAVLTGVVKGLSGWLWAFYRNCHQALTLGQIKYRTYRSASFRRKERTGSSPRILVLGFSKGAIQSEIAKTRRLRQSAIIHQCVNRLENIHTVFLWEACHMP